MSALRSRGAPSHIRMHLKGVLKGIMPKETFVANRPGIKWLTNESISLSAGLFVLVVLIFVALRFWKITSFSLWGGEAFTVIGAKQDWSGMFSYVIADIA